MNMIKKILLASMLGLTAMSSFAAPVLSFGNSNNNVSHNYNLGDTVSLDLWISGLNGTDGDGLGGLDLAGFDMDLSFNGSVTGYQNTSFSNDLDDSLFYGLSANPTSGNTVNLSGLSLSWDLSGQADALRLFTLTFMANTAGTSTFSLGNVILSDSWGNAFASSNYVADINVTERSVPEPSSLALLAGALALVLIRRRKAA